ncbi:MAG: GAF domain-containing protein [Desulfobacterales bacterium]|nr:GAF domain-containing protein [Desulfobacterales bacterium]
MTFYSIPPLLTLICFAALAALAIFRGPRTQTNFLFLTICILGSFLYFDILFAFNTASMEAALRVSRWDHFFIVYLFPVYIHFFHRYLNISGRKWLISASYVYSFILMCFTPTPFYIASMQKYYFGYFAHGGVIYPFFGLACLLVTVYVLVIIYQAIRRETDGFHKNRLKYLFAGFGVMGLMNGLNVFPISGYPVYPPGNLSFIPLIVFAVGLFKHDLLDMGILIRKSLIYSLLTAFLTCLYALIILLANAVFKNSRFSDSFYIPVLFFLLIAFVFGPLKSAVQEFVDRIFYKKRYDYQKTLKQVSQMIVSVLDPDAVAKLLTDTVADTMLVKYCAVFVSSPSGQYMNNVPANPKHAGFDPPEIWPRETPLIQWMKTRRKPVVRSNVSRQIRYPDAKAVLSDIETLKAEIALPMVFEDRLNGFIVLGKKRSGDIYTQEDMDLLETLSSQSALALENAGSYKIIDDMNKALEQKVEERTRDLEQALSEKERTQEQLIRSESLAAIGQLVAGVAHELNNPLTTVTSLIQSAIEDIEHTDTGISADPDMVDDLKFADKELVRARSIVSSLLGLSRQTQTYSESVNLNGVIKDALRILYNQFKHTDLNVIETYDRDLPNIRGNFANLGQVTLNIIQNAIQAVLDIKGTIFLSTHFDAGKRQAVFTCKDTGPGIPGSIRQDIFKPFFTTKAVGKGTGLGLYICHEIVAKHGGTLKLHDGGNTGAIFEVRLPAGN